MDKRIEINEDTSSLPTTWSWPAPDPGPELPPIPDGERRIGEGGEVRCGDWLRPGARRLCGACAAVVAVDWHEGSGLARAWELAQPEGCGDVLERREDGESDRSECDD
jgi:hypothetical protein